MSEKSIAVSRIVSAIIARNPHQPSLGSKAKVDLDGFALNIQDGKIILSDAKGGKMSLEELIQYVNRHLR